MSSGRLLVVDDEPQIRRVLRAALSTQGYEVDDASSGAEALERLRASHFDLVLLDFNMPGLGGLETCRAIRAGSDVAVIMLTVRNTEADTIEALDSGADDYVGKPFSMPELMARIRAVLRRLPASEDGVPLVLKLADFEVNFETRRVITGGRSVRLTPKEYDLLRHLVANANVSISHQRLLQAVWGPDYGDEVEYLRVFINQLRKKIEPDPARPRYLASVRGVGYRFDG